jgi:hypothetical protein
MRRSVTLVIDDAYRALAVAAIMGASCPCGQPARRIVIERDRVPLKARLRPPAWDRDLVLSPDGINVRSWCGRADDDHTGGTTRYGPDMDPDALALVEEDL